MLRFLLCFTFFFQLSHVLWAASLSGKVIDQHTGEPIQGAIVYINNSTQGASTDKNGHFELQGNFIFPLEVVAEAVSYSSRSVRVLKEGALDRPIALDLKMDELPSVQVLAPLKDGWELYGKEFLRAILSYSDFSNECEIMNRKVLQFKLDKEAGILYVNATVPIIIKNKALGYNIHFDLKDFQIIYSKRSVYFAGYSRYVPMVSKNKKQNLKWVSNRQSAYYGSLNHFVRSAYQNTVEQDGFQLNVVVRAPAREYGVRVPVWTDTINLNDTLEHKIFLEKFTSTIDANTVDSSQLLNTLLAIKHWIDTVAVNEKSIVQVPLKDVLATNVHQFHLEKINATQFRIDYYKTDRLPPTVQSPFEKSSGITMTSDDTSALNTLKAKTLERMADAPFDYLYTTPYPIDSFLILSGNDKKLFSENLIQVMYKKEVEELLYMQEQYKCGTASKPCTAPAPQTSTLVFPEKRAVQLMPNGNFNEQYDLFIEGYWSYEKLDKMLPLDYEP